MKYFFGYQSILLTSTVSGLLLASANIANAATLWDTLVPSSSIAFTSDLNIPTETADDFTVTGDGFKVTDVSFLGLLSDPNATINNIDLAFYQVFPEDSDLTRTPITVRTNGPADDEFVAFGSADNQVTFTTTDLGSFTVNQTILPSSGPNAPGLGSGVVGGSLTGQLVQIDAKLVTPLDLAPNAIFLVAAAETSSGEFFQIAGDRPPNFPNPLPSGVVDRQAWFRTNAPFPNALEPDWIRISDTINQQNGTAEPAFNAAFRVVGEEIKVPEPSSNLVLLILGTLGLGSLIKRNKKSFKN